MRPQTRLTYTLQNGEHLLTSASGGVTLGYDPMLRLHQVAGAATTRFAYDGLDMIAEYDVANALQRRFVHGPGMDEPLVQYEGSGTTDRRFLIADERGSIISISDGSGNMLAINRYDEFGKPQTTNAGRFQYTGQLWLSELGLYYYKARVYSPTFGGRFLQTDPIGYEGGANLYAYVGNDPVNLVDPLGLQSDACPMVGARIVCTGRRNPFEAGSPGNFSIANLSPRDIIVSGLRRRPPKLYRLRQCETKWLRQKLGQAGFPTSDLGEIEFQIGWATNANPRSRTRHDRLPPIDPVRDRKVPKLTKLTTPRIDHTRAEAAPGYPR